MKVNKAGFWITFALAVASLVAGIIFLLLPSNCPIVLDGISAETSSTSRGKIYLHGTLTNKSDRDVVVSELVIIVKTSGDTIKAIDDESFTFPAGASLDLYENDYYVNSFDRPQGVTKVTITVDGKSYVLHGTDIPVVAVVLFIVTFICALLAISVFANNRKKKKAYAAAEQALPQFGDNAVTFDGFYSQKGDKGKAVGKSALSVLGGMLSAIFLGIGFYKIYGTGTAVELVVSDNGLYVINSSGSLGTTFFEKGRFPASEITVKKRNVTLTNTSTQENFVFKTTKNGMTPEQLVERLKALTAALPEQTEKAEAETPAPFEELNAETPSAESAVTDGTPAETDNSEEK